VKCKQELSEKEAAKKNKDGLCKKCKRQRDRGSFRRKK